MNKLAIVLLLSISACQSVPVSRPFPAVPEELLAPPKEMVQLNESETRLSEFLSVIIDNNTTCIENSIRLKAWQSWYQTTKQLYEE